MFQRPRRPWWALGIAAVLCATAGCGGGSSAAAALPAPHVVGFSPLTSPIDPNTRQHDPTFTDSLLRTSTHPSYPGRIVVFFNADVRLDEASCYVGGRPELGLDAAALQVLHQVPNAGNVALPLASIRVEADRVVLEPSDLPLADGQYGIVVRDGIRGTDGQRLTGGPVYHAFTVGTSDTVAPLLVGSSPGNGETGVGAGALPLAMPGSGAGAAEVRTNVFGPTSPDVVLRFSEPIDAATVTLSNVGVVNASFPPAAGPPPAIAAAPGFPTLQSTLDGQTLPSNGHEIVWRPDPLQGGFPFGAIIQVSVAGAYATQANADADPSGEHPDHASPLADLAGNALHVTQTFLFETLGPPDLPQNPFPEYALWWSASDRVGAIDSVNQQGLADQVRGVQTFPFGVPRNTVPAYTDTVANARNLPGFSPTELSFDGRTNPATCHSWIYAMSPTSGEIVVIDSRTSIPIAVIETPAPGGISNQTGGGQAANVLVATNASANTLTVFDLSNVTPGLPYVNGPIFVGNVQATGNTPRAVSISLPATGLWSRDPWSSGPGIPLLLYVDYTDGVVNTTRLGEAGPVKRFVLGPDSSPNDVAMTPCFGTTPMLVAAISQGATPGEGKVSYYVAGPNCTTGAGTASRPDDLVGDLTDFDGPAGLDEVLPVGNGAYFAVAESGAGADRVTTLGVEVGAANLPRLLNRFEQVGANPVAVAHRASWVAPPSIGPLGTPWIAPVPSCWYNQTQQYVYVPGCFPVGMWDCTLAPAQDLYICARGAGQVTVVNLVTGARDHYSPIAIPGIRFIAGPPTQ